jgi:hypothetical protein
MAEDAGEQLAGTDRSQLSAAPKSIAEVKAEIAGTRNRIAATIDRTIDRLPSVFRTSQESERRGGLPDSLSAQHSWPLPASRFC